MQGRHCRNRRHAGQNSIGNRTREYQQLCGGDDVFQHRFFWETPGEALKSSRMAYFRNQSCGCRGPWVAGALWPRVFWGSWGSVGGLGTGNSREIPDDQRLNNIPVYPGLREASDRRKSMTILLTLVLKETPDSKKTQ